MITNQNCKLTVFHIPVGIIWFYSYNQISLGSMYMLIFSVFSPYLFIYLCTQKVRKKLGFEVLFQLLRGGKKANAVTGLCVFSAVLGFLHCFGVLLRHLRYYAYPLCEIANTYFDAVSELQTYCLLTLSSLSFSISRHLCETCISQKILQEHFSVPASQTDWI